MSTATGVSRRIQQDVRSRIGRLENEGREVCREMDDMLGDPRATSRMTPRCRQDIAKDIENEIAIAQCRRPTLVVVAQRTEPARECRVGPA